MPLGDCRAILAIGIFFILLGVVFILWNRREKRGYYDSLVGQRDLREFITHDPERSWLGAWQIGGWASLILGIALVAIGAVILFR